MRNLFIFLLLFSGASRFGTLCTSVPSGVTQLNCTSIPETSRDFLTCAGFPSGPGTENQHILNLKVLLEALHDVHSFISSGLDGVPLLNISAGLRLDTTDLTQSDDIVRAWLQVRLDPLLSSVSRNLLSCLGNMNVSCQNYQTVVQKLSQQFSGLDPQRQNLIYSSFMQPFLSKNTTAGCVIDGDTTEDWLLKNFGSFSVMARIRDLSSINALFRGLDVLHLLSPEQKAELLLYPDLAGLDNSTLGQVLDSLLSSITSSGGGGAGANGSTWNPGLVPPTSPVDPLQQLMKDFTSAFRPVGSFAKGFVSFSRQQNLHTMRTATLIQSMLNWTLAELAAPYKQNIGGVQQPDQTAFDPTNVNSWFSHVVTPVLNRYLTSGIPADLTAVFHKLFFMETSVNQTTSGNQTQDVCSVTLDSSCAVPHLVERVMKVLQCASSTNLSLTQETLTGLTLHLSESLNTLLNRLTNTDLSSPDSPLRDLLNRIDEPSDGDLQDELFITLWFHTKLQPSLQGLTPGYLSCLSGKGFSCHTYQIIVAGMNNNTFLMTKDEPHMVYKDFIFPFLLRQNSTGSCSANSSSEWILIYLAGFSQFATVKEMYLLNTQFNALEALDLLTLNQTAELIAADLPQLPEKKQVLETVFNHTLSTPAMAQQLPQLILISLQMGPQPRNCSTLKEMFALLHQALLTLNPETKAVIWSSINNLILTTPPDCSNITGEQNITVPVNETAVCAGVSSSALEDYPKTPHNNSQLCSLNLTQFACAQLSSVTTADLETVLMCNLQSNATMSDQTWKLFLTKVDLGSLLDLLNNKTMLPMPESQSLVVMLDMIGEVTFNTFRPSDFKDNSFIQLWFRKRLRPFLPYASPRFLSSLAKKDFSCETFQSVVKIMNEQFNAMSKDAQMSVYVHFIHPVLKLNQTRGCAAGVNSSEWLNLNLGRFSQFATSTELQDLNPSFSEWEVLNMLTVDQLAQMSSSPSFLSSPAQVTALIKNVPDSELGVFFAGLSSSLTLNGVVLTPTVKEALLLLVFEKVDLTNPTMPDSEVQLWLGRLTPFISSIPTSQVPKYFSIIKQRDCSTEHQGLALLNSSSSSFSAETQQEIYNQILSSLQGSDPLHCLQNQSYYSFLQSYFMSSQFPDLNTYLSLMPAARMPELVNSMSTAELSQLLNRPGVVNNETKLCQIFDLYNNTPQYLQSEPVSSPALAKQTLDCVWPRAIAASSQAEVDQWFDAALVNYVPFLSPQQISFTQLNASSCLAFRKYVSVMGTYNFNSAGFNKQDIYKTIQSYLTTDSTPKCYDPLNPALNSTAWFAQYIGAFIPFITMADLQQFGGAELQPFTVNKQNLLQFMQANISTNVVDFYTQLLYEEDPNFSASLLPAALQCVAPASAYTSLTGSDTITISQSLKKNCKSLDPTVSAALAENLDSISQEDMLALGDSCTGISVGQLMGTPPSALFSTLDVLSGVEGWSLSQAMAIVQSMLSNGVFKVTSMASLMQLGNLVIGVPSSIFSSISAAELLKALQSQAFISDISTAPSITQETIVDQIVTLNPNPDVVVQNVPDSMTPLISRTSLLFLSQDSAATLNRKKWNQQQAVLFFDIVANNFTDTDSISFEVLQGFTCTRAQSFPQATVKKLIRSCRNRNKQRVNLHESQLTCMYNHVKKDTVTSFTDYPADMLLYYNVSELQQSSCQQYYSALGEADFTVFSPSLAFRKSLLIGNARQCLGITGQSLSPAQLDVLGQMICVMDSSYIENSNPYVLEKLKQCGSLSASQSSAVENVLLKGETSYGAPASWNQTTLSNLGVLPLYLPSTFWEHFTQSEQVEFLRSFVPQLNKRGTSKAMISTMITAAGQKSKAKDKKMLRFKRDSACTVGNITQIQANDPSFPFGYDVTQFNACLSVQTLKDNLAAIASKATNGEFQKIILSKLNQAYPSGLSEDVLQVLGPAARAATPTDISKWSITKIDTLSALLVASDGDWSSEQVKMLVNQYLNGGGGGRSLGSLELNSLGGTNLCSLDKNVIGSISSSSLQKANALAVSNCSLEQKQLLFSIAQNAFSDRTISKLSQKASDVSTSNISANSYQLIQSYLGGANLAYVRTLSNSSVNMDLLTFVSLDQNVVNNLTVSEVQGLLGSYVPDLKTYENNTVVRDWISRQLQSDLDKLGIGLTGGKQSSTGSGNGSGNGSGSRVSALPLYQQLLLLAVTIATLQLLH